MMRITIESRRHANGATLIITLFFLIIMAMLGVAIANVSVMEERMAGGTRDRDLALQAAETALKEAETFLSLSPTNRVGLPLLIESDANGAVYWESCFTNDPRPAPCDGANVRTPLTALPEDGAGAVAAQPEFIIQDKGSNTFRVTARAVGGTEDAVVILQAEYVF
jgi:type IV pilus assembly protein PilX